jgi:glycosyltransferase involved in cell wall biosynthesis
MSQLRVLHVTPYYEHAWDYGGIPRVVAGQVRGLSQRRVRVTVATTDACGRSRLPDDLARQSEGSTVTVKVFPNLSNTLARRLQLFLPRGLGSFLDRQAGSFDVAHLHGCHNLPGAVAAGRLLRAGTPYVLQPNGTAPRIERRRLAKLLFDATAGRHTLRDATAVIAVSAVEQRQLEAMGVPEQRITEIPNPVDLNEFDDLPDRGSLRQQLDIGEAGLVLYLGQLSPRKRVDLVVEAVATLDDDSVRLVIAGPDMGSERSLRRLMRERGLEARTTFAGVLAGSDRLAALVDADVVVYPSQHEIFGLVPIEALLCGTPVVVSDDCGCGEVVTRTGGGLVVEHGNPDAVAVAVAQILDAPDDWEEPVSRGATRVRELYSAHAVAARLEELYRSLADGGEEVT